jgi:hypothetical protein
MAAELLSMALLSTVLLLWPVLSGWIGIGVKIVPADATAVGNGS